MEVLLTDRQRDGLLHDAAGYSGIELRIHIGLTVNECLVKVHHLWFRAVEAHGILMTTDIQEVERRLHHHMYCHLCRCIGWQCKAVGQRSAIDRFRIWCQCYGTTRTTIVGIDAPLSTLGSLAAIEVLSLHSHIAMNGAEGVAAHR